MNTILITPTYFPSIAHYVAIVKADTIKLEVQENYQKQSFRNSAFISTDKGKEPLTIPVVYSQKNGHILTKDIKLVKNSSWQKQHLRTLETAYNSSPFFEFYIDDLMPIFEKKYTYLLDVNLDVLHVLHNALELEKKLVKTTAYEIKTTALDLRYLAQRRKAKEFNFEPYTQVFAEEFLANLSILDLLFMEGPNTVLYLERQTL